MFYQSPIQYIYIIFEYIHCFNNVIDVVCILETILVEIFRKRIVVTYLWLLLARINNTPTLSFLTVNIITFFLYILCKNDTWYIHHKTIHQQIYIYIYIYIAFMHIMPIFVHQCFVNLNRKGFIFSLPHHPQNVPLFVFMTNVYIFIDC